LCDHIALINKSKKLIEGPVKQIRNQFKNHVFELEYTGPVIQVSNDFDLVETKNFDSNHKSSRIKIKETGSSNKLLALAIEQAEVHSFMEHIPSMQEIFIKVVSEARVEQAV
jgi:ABC-2 type transport system ATP-binding protein